MTLEFYSNGLTLYDGKFRDYESAKVFLSDIQDGFFPAELQKPYPDGCYFNVSVTSSVMVPVYYY